jgi:hypothetical protein
MGIIPEDNIEKDSIPSLLVRLSKIANNTEASQLYREGSSLQKQTHGSPKEKQEMGAQVLAWKKRVEPFLKQNEVSLNRPF